MRPRRDYNAYNRLPLEGKRFGRLVVLRATKKRSPHSGSIIWKCRCDCGKKKLLVTQVVQVVQSCGCLQKILLTRHGMARTPEYLIWISMRRRCEDLRNPDYGGRGISVAKRWQGPDGFEHFYEDLGKRPKGRSLERKNVNGNYEPGNCRWATAKQQANNRRNSPKNKPVETSNEWVPM